MTMAATRMPRLDVWRSEKYPIETHQLHRNVKATHIKEEYLLAAYSAFLLQLCGSDEVHFHVRKQGGHIDVIQALIDDKGVTFNRVKSNESIETQFCIQLASDSPSSSLAYVFLLEVIQEDTDTSLALTCSSQGVSAKAADALFDALLFHLAFYNSKLRPAALTSSRLNHPPTQQPISFSHETSPSHTLHSTFVQQAVQYPDRIALDFLTTWSQLDSPAEVTSITYRQLDQWTTWIAHELQRRRKVESTKSTSLIVPIYAGPSIELYAGYLACLKAGLAFCPLPLDAPLNRILDILSDVQPAFVLSRGCFPHSTQLTVIDITTLLQEARVKSIPSNGDAPLDLPQIHPNTLAYVLYTSGSTGKSKGVQITHLAASCSISSHAAKYPLPINSRWFQFAAPTFDPSVMEIFVTLCSGSSLCSAERELTLQDVNRTVDDLQATIMMATPSLATLLRPDEVPSLKSLWTMGEALGSSVIETFSRGSSNGRTILVNAYGPTEAAINCTLQEMNIDYRGTILGPALATCSLFIVEADHYPLREVPAGLSGELVIGGPQVSLGYLNRPEQTKAAFVNDAELGRVYRTGDRARIVWTDKGEMVVEIGGRINAEQVKIDGRRVELGEVDTVLNRVEGVRLAVTVQCQPAGRKSSVLVAILALHRSVQEEAVQDACRNAMQKELPTFLHPSRFIILEDVPRNAAGKADRKAIRALIERRLEEQHQAMDSDQPSSAAAASLDISQEQSELEKQLTSALGIVTGTDDVDSTTLLSEVGLSSLGAMRYLQATRRICPSPLTLSDLIEPGCSVRQLASKLINNTLDTASLIFPSDVEFEREQADECQETLQRRVERALRVTATQAGTLSSFYQSCSRSGPKTYIHQTVHTLVADIDITRLTAAFQAVVSRHEAFRIVFVPVDDDASPFAQCILAGTEQLPEHELRLVEAEDGTSIDQIIQETLHNHEDEITLTRPCIRGSFVTQGKNQKSVFVLSIMHTVFDGGSLQLFIEDLQREYHGESALTRTEMTFAVQEYLSATRKSGQASTHHWQLQLSDYVPERFPCISGEKARGQVGSLTVERICSPLLTLPLLEEMASSSRSSVLSIVQLAWSLLLMSYSESESNDVVFGSVVSNRLDSNAQICIAPTFATIPARFQIDPQSPTIQAALSQLTTRASAALGYTLPALGSIKTADGKLPYDTLLALQVFKEGQSSSSLWNDTRYPAMHNDFAVMIEVWPVGDGPLRLKATCNRQLFNTEAADLMLSQFENVITGITRSQPADDVNSLVYSSLPRHLLSITDIPEGKKGTERLLHEHFEEQAQLHPSRPALVYTTHNAEKNKWECCELSYRDVDERATNFARLLMTTNKGWLHNQAVPLSVSKSIELYIAVLGILKAGGAWCPIDATFPPQRQSSLIRRTGAKMIIVEEGRDVSNLEMNDITVVTVKAIPDVMKAPSQSRPRQQSSDLAYLIWTSGTTGEPKGVLIEHGAASIAMEALQTDIPSHSPPRTLQFSAFTFDIFVQDVFYTWGLGGCIVSSCHEDMIANTSDVIAAGRASHAHLTPAFATGLARDSCPSLKVVTMVGEKLTENVANDWSTEAAAFNTYGPAENTVISTVRQFKGQEDLFKAGNIGLPLPTVSAFVLSQNLLPVPLGGVGELALGGPQLARGYLDDETKTSAKFFFNDAVGQRIYLTGDKIRMLHDGNLDFVGRTDDLVKLNGIRVELSEISHSLSKCHQSVNQVETLLLSRPDRPSNVIVCFLAVNTVDKGNQVQVIEVARARAREQLPTYMIPSHFLIIDCIPRSTSAKTDNKKLAEIYASVKLDDGDDQEDGNQECKLVGDDAIVASCLCELLGVSESIIAKSIFLPGLGLDSIKSIQLAAKLKSRQLPVAAFDIMRAHTFTDLRKAVTKAKDRSIVPQQYDHLKSFHQRYADDVAKALDGRVIQLVAPTSTLQANLLVESAREPKSYWSSHLFRLDKSVDKGRLLQAWQQLADKTEMLRTTFIPMAQIEASEKGYLQCIYKDVDVVWTEAGKEPASLSAAANQMTEEVSQDRAPLWNGRLGWTVTILKDEEEFMMFTIHHALHDKNALDLILDSVEQLYRGSAFSDHTQLTRALQLTLAPDKEQQKETEAYWSKMLEPLAASCTPWSLPNLTGCDTSSVKEKKHNFTTPISTSKNRLSTIAQKFNMTSSAPLLQAAFAVVLSEYLEQEAVLIGTTISERGFHPDLETAIAPLIATLPFVISRQGKVSNTFKSVSKQWQSSLVHRHISAKVIRDALQWPREQALYPAIFVFHPAESSNDTLAEKQGTKSLWNHCHEGIVPLLVDHSIAINIYDGEQFEMSLSVSNQVMSANHVAIFAQQIDAQLSAMIEHLDANNSQLSSFIPRHLLSVSKPNVSMQAQQATQVHPYYWLHYYAQHHPDWCAAEEASEDYTTRSWSYSRLHQRACQYANLLRRHTSDCSGVVALCMDRTLEAFAAVLGIFQTGNVYLAIADDLPNERKKALIKEADAKVVLASFGLEEAFTDQEYPVIATDTPQVVSMLDEMSEEYSLATNIDGKGAGYLLFTSGSSGKPKGVRVSNGNLSAYIEGYADVILQQSKKVKNLAGKGKQLNLASRAFDPHISQMFLSWRLGFCAVTGPRSLFLEDLPRAINELSITHVGSLPSVLDQNGLTPSDVPSLAVLAVGGEKITRHVLDTWASSGDISVFNLYGPTETTIGCTLNVVTPSSGPKNIGFPLGNSSALVVQPGTLDVVKLGQTGELCIAGDLVAQGYHQKQEKSGFCKLSDGTSAYRTGDVVQMLTDGSIEFLGRKDEQIKIRGQRLELSEVNETVLSAPILTPIVVTTVYTKHPQLPTPRLFTFVGDKSHKQAPGQTKVTFINGSEWSQTITQHSQQNLPSFMVPSILSVEAIPLLPSGKVNVKQAIASFCATPLSDALGNSPSDQASPERELNDDETRILEVIKQVTGTHDFSISIHSEVSIFELGIDSLSAVSLSIQVKKLGYEASVAALLASDTVSRIARLPRTSEVQYGKEEFNLEAFDRENRRHLHDSHFSIPSSFIDSILPALPLQQALVALSMGQAQEHAKALYVHHAAFEIQVDTSTSSLEEAWKELVEREVIFRSCFSEGKDGSIVQVVIKQDEVENVTHSRSKPHKNALSDWQRTQQAVGKDIVNNMAVRPPYRVSLLDQSSLDKPSLMLLSIHHSLYDGESLPMLLRDLSQLSNGEAIPLRPQSLKLLCHVAQQDEERTRSFWSSYLGGFHPTSISAEKSGNTVQDNRKVELQLSTSTYSALKARALQLKTTLPVIYFAIFSLVLAKKLNRRDVIIGNVMNGRLDTVTGVDQMMTPCITTVPLRTRMQGLKTIESVVQEAKQSLAKVWPFQHTSLAKIQRWTGCEDHLFDTLFSYNVIQGESDEVRQKTFSIISTSHATNYPLALDVEVNSSQETAVITLGYSASSIKEDEASIIVQQLQLLLTQLSQGESMTLEDLELPEDDEVSKERDVEKDKEWDNDLPWKPQEEQIRAALAKTLQIQEEDITRSKTFYLLGLDSILAIKFTRLLREAGFNVHTALILQSRCIGALWASMSAKEEEKDLHEKKSISSNDSWLPLFQPLTSEDKFVAAYACTPLQSGMLSQSEVSEAKSSYAQQHCIRLRQGVDIKRIKSAWQAIVEAHDILRTTFHLVDDSQTGWVAIVHSKAELQWFDASEEIGKARRDDMILPLVSVSVMDKDVTFNIHHALYDGVSLPMMFAKLRQCYHEEDFGIAPPFYMAARYIVQSQDRANDFWSEQICNYAYAPLSHAQVNAPQRWRTSKQLAMTTTEMESVCRSKSLSLQSVALLSYAKVLSKMLNHRDIAFGQVISGRSLPLDGATEVVGPLFNTIPIRVTLASAMESNLEAAQKIQSLSESAHGYQTVCLRDVQNRWRRNKGGSRLFDCLFLFNRETRNNIEQSRILWDAVDIGTDDAQDDEYDVNFSFIRRSEQVTIGLSASNRVVSGCTELQDMATLFDEIMTEILSHLSQPALAHPSGLDRVPLTGPKQSTSLPIKVQRSCQGVEIVLQQAFCKQFKESLDKVGPSTNLLMNGVDSISAIRLARNCQQRGAKITAANIIQGQTIEDIVSLAALDREPSSGQERYPLVSPMQVEKALSILKKKEEDVQEILPCLAGQQHHLDVWLAAGRRFLEAPWIFRADGVEESCLESAWESLRRRHSILRTCFVAVDDETTVQVVLKSKATPRAWESKTDTASLEGMTLDYIKETSDSPVDLYSPPVRICLLAHGKHSAVIIRLQHATYDARSIQRLLADLEALYRGHLPSSSNEFSAYVRHMITSMDKQKQRLRWITSLENAQTTILSSSGRTGNDETAFGPQILVRLPEMIHDTAKLQQQCRQGGTSLQLAVMISFARLLSKHTTAKDYPTYGFYHASRTSSFPDIVNLAGPTLNVLPIAVSLASLSTSLFELQNELSARIPFEQSSLRDILGWLKKEHQQPFFNCYLNLLWQEADVQSSSETLTQPLLTPWKLSKSTDYFTTQEARPSSQTALGNLSTSYLPKNSFYVDVGLRNNKMGFGIRASALEYDEEWIKYFGQQFAAEIMSVVEEVCAM